MMEVMSNVSGETKTLAGVRSALVVSVVKDAEAQHTYLGVESSVDYRGLADPWEEEKEQLPSIFQAMQHNAHEGWFQEEACCKGTPFQEVFHIFSSILAHDSQLL